MEIAAATPETPRAPAPVQAVCIAHELTGRFGWIYTQALYSMLSLLAVHEPGGRPGEISLVVYTDDPSQFRILGDAAEFRAMTREQALRWMGRHKFGHRLKLEALQDAAAKASGPLAYFDIDVYFRAPLREAFAWIAPGRSVLHALESDLARPADRKERELRAIMRRDAEFDPDAPARVYNVGAIGIHPADFRLIGESLAMTDRFLDLPGALKAAQSHLWEQIALSFALDRATQIRQVEAEVCHYWSQREEHTAAIEVLLAESKRRAMGLSDTLAFVRERPLNVPPYRRPSLARRAWRKMTGDTRVVSRRILDMIAGLD